MKLTVRKQLQRWKSIDGYGGRYEISNYGYVRNAVTKKISKFILNDGYHYVYLYRDNKDGCDLVRVNRLVAKAFIPNPFNLPVVNHLDEVKTNDAADNLEYCSFGYNVWYSRKGKLYRERGFNTLLPIIYNLLKTGDTDTKKLLKSLIA